MEKRLHIETEKKVAEIGILPGEYWYGGAVNDGYLFPLSENDEYELNVDGNDTYCQINPVYLSSKGRYLWFEGGKVKFGGGKITLETPGYELCEAGTCLKDAALAAAKKHYPPDGTLPEGAAFAGPQFCTWMALGVNQNEEGILRYAEKILSMGIRPGVLILDDGWQRDYGDWRFAEERFQNPGKMMSRLKAMGFKVMLWLVPYISPAAPAYHDLKAHGALITDENGEIFMAHWWKGESAVLDLTVPYAAGWLKVEMRRMREEFGADGFKLDGGDAMYLPQNYPYANLQDKLWIDSFPGLKEGRACYQLGGKGIIQRLADKAHIWGVETASFENGETYLKYGLSSVMPQMLTQGITGYLYGCPDMVGGGLFADVEGRKLNAELVARSCAISALMPMMQFSLDVWDLKEHSAGKLCKKFVAEREKFTDYIMELARHASRTGEPIVRYMEYMYPHAGFEKITDQMMLGEKYMIAAVTQPGQKEREVVFPEGRWKNWYNGRVYEGGRAKIACPLDEIPLFEKI